MIIPIDDKYRIKSNEYCWMIQQRNGFRVDKDTGEKSEKWDSIHWYANPKQCVKGLGNLMVRTSEAQTLTEALETIEIVSERLTQALTPHLDSIS